MPVDGDVVLNAVLNTANVEKSIEGLKGLIKKSFSTLIRYGFGVRSFYFLFRKLRKELIDGFGNLAQVSQPFNSAMSSMMNALANLKSSFASAFAPILQAVAPAITTFINLMADAVDAVGKLIAALTGQKTYTKYIATQQDYATAVGDTADNAKSAGKATDDANKSAKKYQRTLAGFDDVEILKEPTSDSSSGGSGSGGGGKLSPIAGVDTTAIADVFTDLADKLKKAWKAADFTEIGTIVGNKLKDALDNMPWAKIKGTLWRIARSAATFLNGFFETPGLFTSIGTTIAKAFNTAFTTVNTFVTNLHWASIGSAVVDAIVGFFSTFDWKLFGTTLFNLLRGLLQFFRGAVKRFPWKSIPTYITTAIDDFLRGFDWETLLNETIGLIKEALDGLIEMISGTGKKGEESPIVAALNSLKESVSKIDPELFSKLAGAIGNLVQALAPVAEGFGAGVVQFISDLVDLGVLVITLLSGALNGIADALNKVDPEILENIGSALGTIASAFFALKVVWPIVQGFAGVITSIKNAYTGFSAESTVAAGGIKEVAEATEDAGSAATGAEGLVAGFFTKLVVNSGVTALVTKVLKGLALGYDSANYSSKNAQEGVEAVRTALEESIDTTAGYDSSLGNALLQLSLYGKGTTDFSTAFNNAMEDIENGGINVDTFKTKLQEMLAAGVFNTSQAKVIQDYISDIGTSASDATTDTSDLSGVFDEFKGLSLSVPLKMALLSAAVDSIGKSGQLSKEDTDALYTTLDEFKATPTQTKLKAIQTALEDSGVSADEFKTAFDTAMSGLPKSVQPSYTKLFQTVNLNNTKLKKKGTTGGDNFTSGIVKGIEDKEKDIQDTIGTVADDDLVGTFENKLHMQSPSKVMFVRGQYIMDGLKNGIQNRQTTLIQLISNIISAMNTKITSFSKAFETSGTTLMTKLYNGTNSKQKQLTNLASSIAKSMQNQFKSDDWRIIGNNAAVGIYNGFVALNGKLQQMVYNVASNMKTAAEKALDIGSPSKEFAWIGEMTMLGLANGITDNEKQPINAVSDITENLEDAAKDVNLGITLNTKLSELLNEFDLILGQFSDTIIERFDNLIGSLAILNSSAFVNIPGVVQGKVAPYSFNSTANNASQMANLKSIIDGMNSNRLTREDINEIVETAIRNMPIELYIGDEQVARHANIGNARLSRRFS